MSTVTQQTGTVITTQPAAGEPNTGEPVNSHTTDLSNQNDQALASEKEGSRRKKKRSDNIENLDDCDCNCDCGHDFDFDCGCDDFDCGCDDVDCGCDFDCPGD